MRTAGIIPWCIKSYIAFLRISITICSHYKEKHIFYNTYCSYAAAETVIRMKKHSSLEFETP